jgi:hypothetical protein
MKGGGGLGWQEGGEEQITVNVLHCNTYGKKILQISCKGRKPRNWKTKGAAENQRNARLCITESRKPGFLDYKSSVHTPSAQKIILLRNYNQNRGSKGEKKKNLV